MKALIDADWFAYAFGNATDDEYKPLAWPFVKSRIDGTIRKIIEATKAGEYQLYITSNDKSNFRYEVATIKPYKGNRPTEKPFYYDKIRKYLVEGKGAIEVFGMEADDAVSIVQWEDYLRAKTSYYQYLRDANIEEEFSGDEDCNEFLSSEKMTYTTICSIDKDLNMVPGHHYNWMKEDEGVYWIDELSGLKNFYCQLLTGDSVDNIPGLFGVGKSSKLLFTINEYSSELDMYVYVLDQYRKRFGSYAEQFLIENARLLWMMRTKEDIWELPQTDNGDDENE